MKNKHSRRIALFPTNSPQPMKTLAAALFLLLALNVPMHAGENGSKTKEAWIALIKADAKLSSLEALLGPPDNKKSFEDLDGPRVREDWHWKFDSGTKRPDDLRVMASPYKGEMIIWAMLDPVSGESYVFPWADKARRGTEQKQTESAPTTGSNGPATYTEEQLRATLSPFEMRNDGVATHTFRTGLGDTLVEARNDALYHLNDDLAGQKYLIISEQSKAHPGAYKGYAYYIRVSW